MNFITYQDYLNYLRLKPNTAMKLSDNNEEYTIEKAKDNKSYTKIVTKEKNTDKSHDKMFRNIFSNKKELVNFLNNFLHLNEEIEESNVVQYSTDYITKQYKARQADIVYRLKNKPVYFLIEHQSTVDHEMLLRIYEYAGEIIRRESIAQKTYLKETIYPIVVPIVIYTGFQKWSAKTNFKEKQFYLKRYEEYQLNLKYNLISVQNYSFEELFEKDTLISKIMIIEKCKTKEELNEQMYKIIKNIKEKDEKETFSEIIVNILQDIIGKESAEKMIKKLYENEEVDSMTALEKIFYDERKEGKKEVIRGMIRSGAEDNFIIKVSKISQKELDKIKKEMDNELTVRSKL